MFDSIADQKQGNKIVGVGSAALAFLLTSYTGYMLAITALIAAGIWAVVNRSSRGKRELIAAPFAIQAAHLIWFTTAIFVGQWAAVAPDILFTGAGLLWLVLVPSLAALWYLSIIQVLSLGVNASVLIQSAVGSPQHRALTAHIVLRVAAIALCIYAGWKLRSLKALSVEADSKSTPESSGE